MKDPATYRSLPLEPLRDRVLDALASGYSRELVSLEEYETRAREAANATDRDTLMALVAELPEPLAESPTSGKHVSRPAGEWMVSSSEARESEIAVSIFGGTSRRGSWRTPKKLYTIAVFGGASIDLRKAIIPPEGLTINCVAAFGGIGIIVPPGMRLETQGMGFMGGFDRTGHEADDLNAPLVRVHGIAAFGGVGVQVRS